MNKEVFIAVMVVVAIVVALAFTQINLNTTAASTDKNINNNTGEIIVTIQNGTFNPANLTVKAGTRVTWIVKDDSNNKYMVTSNANGSVEGKYLFMSDHLTSEQNFSYTFNKIGTYGYYDMDHMGNQKLTGFVIVQ